MSKESYNSMIENLANIKGISKKDAAQIIIKAVKSFDDNLKKERSAR